MKRLFKKYLTLTILTLSLVIISACQVGIDSETRQILKDAIDELKRQPGRWEGVLNHTINQLGDVASETAKKILSQVQATYTRALANTQSASFCGADFIGIRVKQTLEMIYHDFIPNTPKPTRTPVICLIDKDEIDVGKTQTIHYSGFDFYEFHQDGSFTVDLEYASSGQMVLQNVGFVAVRTNYQLSIDIQSLAQKLSHNNIDYSRGPQLILKWNNQKIQGKSALIIVGGKQTRRRLEIGLSSLNGRLRGRDVYFIPPKVGRGDTDFKKRVEIIVQVEVRISNDKKKIEARLYMDAYEGRHDWTRATGHSNWEEIYETESGWELIRIISPSDESLRYLDKTCCHIDRHRGEELVESWEVIGDTDGGEAGKRTGVSVSFRRIQVELQKRVF